MAHGVGHTFTRCLLADVMARRPTELREQSPSDDERDQRSRIRDSTSVLKILDESPVDQSLDETDHGENQSITHFSQRL
jgi:hypothetical protein